MRPLALGLLGGAAAVALAAAPQRASAQTAAGNEPTTLEEWTTQDERADHDELTPHEELRAAERRHLRRVGLWGLANVTAGSALALSTDRGEEPGRHGFGVQTAGWGLVNTGIALAGLAFGGRGEPPESEGEALAAESRWGQILVLNLGLNAGYVMAGGALVWASGRDMDRADEIRGHASAVMVQGLGLFVLDGIAWLGHRQRMEGFAELLDGATVSTYRTRGELEAEGQHGVAVRIPFRGTP